MCDSGYHNLGREIIRAGAMSMYTEKCIAHGDVPRPLGARITLAPDGARKLLSVAASIILSSFKQDSLRGGMPDEIRYRPDGFGMELVLGYIHCSALHRREIFLPCDAVPEPNHIIPVSATSIVVSLSGICLKARTMGNVAVTIPLEHKVLIDLASLTC